MKYDIIAAGVGGQGVLSLGAIIAAAARQSRLQAVQSEVHGMSQRGGAVTAHLRLADVPIHSATIDRGRADLILALEPLESLRYLEYLAPDGTLLTASDPVTNIPDYPPIQGILQSIQDLPHGFVVDANRIARECGGAKVANVVLLGAASDFLPIEVTELRQVVAQIFQSKGPRVVQVNLDAFEAGRSALRVHEIVHESKTVALPRD